MPEGMRWFFYVLFLIVSGAIAYKVAEHYFKDTFKEMRLI